jgi:hypothetical protein
MGVSGQVHVPAALSRVKQPPVPTVYETGWAGLDVMEKTLLSLTGIEPRFLDRPALSLVAIRTELSRLPNTDSVNK